MFSLVGSWLTSILKTWIIWLWLIMRPTAWWCSQFYGGNNQQSPAMRCQRLRLRKIPLIYYKVVFHWWPKLFFWNSFQYCPATKRIKVERSITLPCCSKLLASGSLVVWGSWQSGGLVVWWTHWSTGHLLGQSNTCAVFRPLNIDAFACSHHQFAMSDLHYLCLRMIRNPS